MAAVRVLTPTGKSLTVEIGGATLAETPLQKASRLYDACKPPVCSCAFCTGEDPFADTESCATYEAYRAEKSRLLSAYNALLAEENEDEAGDEGWSRSADEFPSQWGS